MHNRISPNKNFLVLLFFLILFSFLLTGCWGYPYPPNTTTPPVLPTYLTEIVVQPGTMDLEEGESQSIISVTAYYSDSSTADIPLSYCTYYNYNPSCASVNSSGLITGVSTGTAVILVIYTESAISKTDTVTINVTTAPTTPAILSYIKVSPSVMSLNVGESQTFNSVTAYYSDSSSANVNLTTCNYSSSNPDCATVSNSGTVTAVSDGSSTITISYAEGGVTKTTSAEITVGTVIQNEVVYRALCVGVGDYMYFPDSYGNIDLPGPPYDVNRICYTLDRCRFGSVDTEFSEIWYITDLSATKSSILQAITNVFAEADYNDVSYFYFSGHGIRVNNISYLCPTEINYSSPMTAYISVNELESALSTIPGTKVIFLDSCHSGGFIGKSTDETITSKEELESFNDEIITIFSQTEDKGLLTTNQYKVLTACHYYQQSMELVPATPGDFPFGVFTMALCEGCGYSGNYLADTNMDTMVSLQEAYLYVKSYVADLDAQLPDISITQDVQVYPDNSSFTIVEY